MNRFSIQKKIFQFFIFITLPFATLGQTRTVIAEGTWDTGTTWQSGEIADAVGEDVEFTATDKTISVPALYNAISGNLDLGTSGHLEILGTLNIGDAGNSKNLTASALTARSIEVTGTLIIWGDVVIANKIDWAVSGSVIIKGNLTMGDNSTLNNSGNFTVDGNFTSGAGTIVQNNGAIDVGGAVTVGVGSFLFNNGTFTYQSCSGAGFCPLPIVLRVFVGEALNKRNLLTWIVSTEINFDHFEIERSLDGILFYTIGQISGAGHDIMEIETHYSFEDKNPVIGKNYYRLKAVDLDQYFEYSKVIMVNWKGSKNISLYPSPSDGSFIALQTNFNPTENEFIQIFDNLGVKLEEFKVLDSKNKLEFRSKLLKGNYLLRYVSDRHHQVIKFSVK